MHIFFALVFLSYTVIGAAVTFMFIELTMDPQFTRSVRIRTGGSAAVACALSIFSLVTTTILILSDDAAIAAFTALSVY